MKIHFIGIGGIGVSALARYYLAKGHEVSGSDLASSEITKALEKLGAKIFIGKHKAENLPRDVDLVIYSPAVTADNPELKKAKKLKIKCQSYPQALGELTKNYFTIAVCGSHGKSTVAAMIGLILTKAGLNPTVILGTKLREFGDSNFRMGGQPNIKHQTANSEQRTAGIEQFLVIEADEYKESFLNYWPKIIVLLNIEYDHPDYFKDLNHYILAYEKFVSNLPKDGILIANKDDKNTFKTFKNRKAIWYSLKEKESKKLRKILKIPGEFNVSNALAALKVARVLKIPDKISFKVLSQFRGTWRRFEEKTIKLNAKSYKLINDYGHHPTQVKATLEAAREKYKRKTIWCIFQPHQYQRTYYLFDDFVKVFKEHPVDKVIITDIYTVSGRESKEIMRKVNAQKLVKAINKENVIYLPKEKIIDYLKKNLRGGEVVMIMGAGDIYNLYLKIQKMLNKKIISALKIIYERLKKGKINWVLVGSVNLALQGIKIRTKDIDILTDRKGAFKANRLLKEYEVEPVKLKWWKLTDKKILEYFGKFKIGGINVEILANRKLGRKQKFLKRELFFRKFIKFKGMKLPVAPLEEELRVYSQLGREKDLIRIKKIKEALKKKNEP